MPATAHAWPLPAPLSAPLPAPVPGMMEDRDASTRADASLDLSEAFRAHGAFVFRSLRRLGVADAALDDMVQEVFLVAFRRGTAYDPAASMRSWLFGIARRVASHHHRSRRRAERHLEAVPAPEPSRDPLAHAERREAVEFVEAFLARLDVQKREVFVACCIEGLSVPEVAQALETNLNTVYSRLRAAKQAFERALAHRHAREEI